MPAQAWDLVERMKNSPVSTGPRPPLKGAHLLLTGEGTAPQGPSHHSTSCSGLVSVEGQKIPGEAGLTKEAPALAIPLDVGSGTSHPRASCRGGGTGRWLRWWPWPLTASYFNQEVASQSPIM